MRLLQWNIQWCRGMDGRVDPARIARVAREICDPDICCFQEVAENFDSLAGSSGENQSEILENLFAGYSAHFGCAVDVPDARGGRRRFGNMILSRFPVRQVFRHSLPWPAHAETPSMPRVALEAVIEAPFGALRVATTHLEYYSDIQRIAQVERLRELHAEACARARSRPSARYDSGPFQPLSRPMPAILCGDFNLPKGPEDAMYARMQAPIAPDVPRYVDSWKHLNANTPHPPTFCLHDRQHGTAPYCCDFVFVSEDLAPRIAAVRVDGDTQASDHQPVIIELRP